MTAVVGILNKQAVAIAADSAVTIGGATNHKIFNKANKVFTLSKQHPVGIMIYNSASFMGTPWETIIKVYRKQLGQTSFPTVRGYQTDFLEFLRKKKFYTSNEIQSKYFEYFTEFVLRSAIDGVIQKYPNLLNDPTPQNKELFIQQLDHEVENLIAIWNRSTDYCPEFGDYTFDMFDVYVKDVFAQLIQSYFLQNGIDLSDALQLKLKQAVFAILRSKEEITDYTGLIFTGFGDDEIYPQLVPVIISMAVDNRLRYYIDEKQSASITIEQNGAVRPFAQTDVIDTILSGIDPR